jgi:hypothetical protein
MVGGHHVDEQEAVRFIERDDLQFPTTLVLADPAEGRY